MIVSIVACGFSAKEWYKTPCDLSIGVNDCTKYGHQVDWLTVVNAPNKFTAKKKNNHEDRLSTIITSKPKRFFAHNGQWKQYFPNCELLQIHPFRGSVKKDKIYFSKTSPFVAIHQAYSAGASDIILWGVDFLDHPKVNGKLLHYELSEYRRLFEALEAKNIKVWLGNNQSVLKEYLKVYKLKTI